MGEKFSHATKYTNTNNTDVSTSTSTKELKLPRRFKGSKELIQKKSLKANKRVPFSLNVG